MSAAREQWVAAVKAQLGVRGVIRGEVSMYEQPEGDGVDDDELVQAHIVAVEGPEAAVEPGERVVAQLRLPVPVVGLSELVEALETMYGAGLVMQGSGAWLQVRLPREVQDVASP